MPSSLLLALAQINPIVGNFNSNINTIIRAVEKAEQQGVQLLVFPELSLTGYQPEDFLYKHDFLQKQEQALATLIEKLEPFKTMHVVIGHIHKKGDHIYNAASVIAHGTLKSTYLKATLPNHSSLDEQRYFTAGDKPCVFNFLDHCFGLVICEDSLTPHMAQALKEKGAQSLLVLNATAYHANKSKERIDILRKNITVHGMNVFSCNMVGGQDEFIFEGHSLALNRKGECIGEVNNFVEALSIYALTENTLVATGVMPLALPSLRNDGPPLLKDNHECLESELWRGLVLATKDYCLKNDFSRVVLGLSGGIDSAVVLAIAVDALGANNVHAIMMPSPYTTGMSLADAKEMANRLTVRYDEIAISPLFDAMAKSLEPIFTGLAADTTEENIQARIRGMLLMAVSNKLGGLVLSTGNKSELATGYCTLYGDMVGGFAVLKDIYKTRVYRLAKWRNTLSQCIPERIITRAPSAELRDNQTDQDSLPSYDVLDAILEKMIEQRLASQEVIAEGFDTTSVEKVAHLLRISEYKRRQGALGPKVTTQAFGRDWRIPLSHAYRY